MVSDFEKAKKAKKRIFLDTVCDSIKTCPENYVLAVRFDGNWIVKGDPATKKYWPLFQKVINQYMFMDDRSIIRELNKVAPNDFKKRGIDVDMRPYYRH